MIKSLEFTTINKRGVIDVHYVAVFNEKTIHLWAASDGQARQRAIEHFKPKKKQVNDLIILTGMEYMKRAL